MSRAPSTDVKVSVVSNATRDEERAAIKIQAAARGRNARKLRQAVVTGARAVGHAAGEIVAEVKAGEDALGAVVHQVSKASTRANHVLHCCNHLGFQWADRQRVPIMAVNIVLGLTMAAGGFVGVLGMLSSSVIGLPWGVLRDIPLDADSLQWWYAGPFGEAFFSSFTPPAACLNVSFLQPNSTALTGSAFFNAWGMCYQVDDADVNACFAYAPDAGSPAGALCRGWGQFSDSAWVTARWSGWEQGKDLKGDDLLECQASIGVDKFMIVMALVGSIIKIVEPIGRMQAKKDIHQKTLAMLITVFGAIAPSIALARYSTLCMEGLEAWSRPYGVKPSWGFGAFAFSCTVWLLPPVVFLHIIVPSGTHSNIYQTELTRKRMRKRRMQAAAAVTGVAHNLSSLVNTMRSKTAPAEPSSPGEAKV